MSQRSSGRGPIAIVGMSGRFPGAGDVDSLWRIVREGRDTLEEFSDEDLTAAGVTREQAAAPGWVRRGSHLADADKFDAAFFGYSPREAQALDPQQRVFLECAWEAIEHAGYAGALQDATVGLYAGTGMNTYLIAQVLRDPAFMAAVGGYQLMLGNDKDFLCTRVSYKLDLRGPSVTVQTACSTSLVAVQMAALALQRGECDVALAGGVSIAFPQRGGYLYQEGMILSPDGVCRPFDKMAKGTRPSAGAGIVVLKRLADAISDRDTVHAVILGAATNNDGAAKAGYTAPSIDGQLEVIATAHALAGIEPRTLSYVEAHGTGTPLGDPIEIAALTQAFRVSTDERNFCALGSLKANLGHLDAAAGVAGLIKTTMALAHRELPPLVHFTAPNPQLNLDDSPFRVPTSAEPWSSDDGPRRAGVSSFGIGGTNAHVVLEESPEQAPSRSRHNAHLLVLSARSETALDRASHDLAAYLAARPDQSLADVAYTLQVGRATFAHRRAVVAKDSAEAAERLKHTGRPPVVTGKHEGGTRRVAFMFSGQGSQHRHMAASLYATEEAFRNAFDECALILDPIMGCDVRERLMHGSDQELSETWLAQPLLFSVERALAALWQSWGVTPDAMIGHSIGEYTAAHLAGVFSLQDALTLVAARGALMQTMPAGGMLAVHLPESDLLRRLTPSLDLAAVNAPTLCTVAGPSSDLDAFAHQLSKDGIEHRSLHTSHAFHSQSMDGMLPAFGDVLARVTFNKPSIPYVSNVTGTWIRAEEATSPEYYLRHLRGCVRFAAGVQCVGADPATVLLEVGPGTALASLSRLTLGSTAVSRCIGSLPHPTDGRDATQSVLDAVGRLWVSGVDVSFQALHETDALRRVPLPTYPFERSKHWVEGNAQLPTATSTTTDKAEVSANTPQRNNTIEEWFQRASWVSSPRVEAACQPVEGTWMIVGHGDELSGQLRDAVQRAGARVVEVGATPHAVPDNGAAISFGHTTAEYEALIRTHRPSTILFALHAKQDTRDGTDSALVAPLWSLARALCTVGTNLDTHVVVLTSGAQQVDDEPITHPQRALLQGLALCLPVEHGRVRMRTLDVTPPEGRNWGSTVVDAVVAEATSRDDATFVSLRGSRRYARHCVRSHLPTVPEGLDLGRERGVYLITGGLGGIGLTLAESLATKYRARLVLTSRRAAEVPPRSEWDNVLSASSATSAGASSTIRMIQKIESLGGEVRIHAADVADPIRMSEVIAAVHSEWGDIHGVIHAAGVAGNALVALTEPDQVRTTIDSKVRGLDVLRDLLGNEELDFVALCSSINTQIPVPASSAYTGANAYFDAFAQSAARPRSWKRVCAIGWDAWRDVGMAAAVEVAEAQRAARKAYVDAGIGPHEGAMAFERAMVSGYGTVTVSPFPVEEMGRLSRAAHLPNRWRGPVAASPVAPTTPTPPSADAADGTIGASADETIVRVARIWEELLGVTQVQPDDDFFALGGHSLVATRLLARIGEEFNVRLTLRHVFDAPTVAMLSEIVDEHRGAVPLLVPADDTEREEFEL